MLRTLVFTVAIGAAGFAAAEDFPESAIGVEVRSDDGTVVGRVEAVERDAHGRIVAAELSGMEPADAPFAPRDLIAQRNDQNWRNASERDDRREGSGRRQTQTR